MLHRFSLNAEPSRGTISAQLEKILGSAEFATSAKLRKFLHFIVQETLEGRSAGIKEYSLGVKVFERGESFDPRIDPIVRVQARNLRGRLAQYYATTGRFDPLRIELPKGSYVPVFHRSGAGKTPAVNWRLAVAAGMAMISLALGAWRAAEPVLAGFEEHISLSADTLSRQLTSFARPRTAVDPEAHSLYVRGRYLLNRYSEEALWKSAACFELAIARDPGYASAYAGLADALNLLVQFAYIAPDEGMTRAKAAARKAIELSPTLAEAHLSLAEVLEAYDWDWRNAEREYRQAIALDPQLASAHLWYGMFLRDQGRTEKALPELEVARQLDPLSVMTNVSLAHLYAMKKDYRAAIRRIEDGAEIAPLDPHPSFMLAGVYREMSRTEDAAAALETARRLSGKSGHALAVVGTLYADMGRTEKARVVLRELEDVSRRHYVAASDLASLHLAVGDRERAVELLLQAFRERETGMVFLRCRYALLHSDPRVRTLVNRMRFTS